MLKNQNPKPKTRRRIPLKALPAFGQVCAIVVEIIQQHPGETIGEVVELAKRRHLAIGYQYDNGAIHRAYSAVATVERLRTGPRRPSRRPRLQLEAPNEDPPWGPYDRGQDRPTSLSAILEELRRRGLPGSAGSSPPSSNGPARDDPPPAGSAAVPGVEPSGPGDSERPDAGDAEGPARSR